MGWRRARSLEVLGDEIEAAWPGTTVWYIGDEAHQDNWSDHNPNVCCDVVCAADVKDDGGMDLAEFVHRLLEDPHPNLRYVIYRDKIYHRANGFRAEDYGGAYHKHVHVSVGNGPDGRSTARYDSTAAWGIGKSSGGGPKPAPPSNSDWTEEAIMAMRTLKQGARGRDVGRLQGLLAANGFPPRNSFNSRGEPDDIFGDGTGDALEAFQEARNVRNSVRNGKGDRICGRWSWTYLLGQD